MAICFLEGSAITVPGGTTLVENLRVGDDVSLPNGGTLKVTFIGKQSFDLVTTPEAHPITIDTNSIAEGVPNKPLHLSAKHGVWNDRDWFRAEQLANGHSISLMDNPPSISHYYNIGLEEWAAVLAHNLSCESYRDLGNRNEFHFSTQTPGQSLKLVG